MRRARHSINHPFIFIRAVLKQTAHIVKLKILCIRHSASAPLSEVIFWPSRPHPYSVAYRACHLLGVKIKCRKPKPGDMAFLWDDSTFVSSSPADVLINGHCLDISKNEVERIHRKIFGYGLKVNPSTYSGRIVVKSDINGAHDGLEVEGPITDPKPGVIYQVCVDNRPPDGSQDKVCDLRVVIFSGEPAFVYSKVRDKSDRFSNVNLLVSLEPEPTELFTADEIDLIREFCREAGLDYGEIDIVRDWDSRKIHILDVNKTPLGPPNGLPADESQRAMQLYTDHFRSILTERSR